MFRRFTETHFQRGYTCQQISMLLEKAGLTAVELMDADTEQSVCDTTQRVLVVAREQGKTVQ